MLDMKFEGYYIDNGVSKSIRIVDKPSKEYILSKLNELNANCRGTVMIENVLAKEDIEPSKLTMYMANGRYLLMLLDYDDEGYLDVRTAYNPDASRDDWEYVNGELHSSTTVISDLEVVKQCFLEFNATGNVSKNLLS